MNWQLPLLKQAQSEIIGNFIKTSKKMNRMETFDEGLWGGMVEQITIFNIKKVVFTFKDGIEITISYVAVINSYY